MAATYTDPPVTDKDWVRFLVGDTDVSPVTDAMLTDSEIDAILGEQSNKYLAAARALSNLRTRWASAKRGIVEKQVSRLRIRWGYSAATQDAIGSRIAELRALGMPSPSMFEMV